MLISTTSSDECHEIEIKKFTIKSSHCEKLLGMHFDSHLKFDFHIEKMQIERYMH